MASSPTRNSKRPVRFDVFGFTVIEVAVALTVISVGMLSLAAVIPLMKQDVVRTDQRSRAGFLAQETAEWLHGLEYADTLLASGEHVSQALASQGYDLSWDVEVNIPVQDVKRVTVTVARSNRPQDMARIVFLHARAGR